MNNSTHNNRDRILKIIGLIGIVLIASILRLIFLTSFPAGFNADEASIGYNAWSILKTGKDEFGNLFPIAFTSFGDFKPSLYFYLTVPYVFFFGLSELAVRLPSALIGIGTVFLLYFLVKKIFQNETIALLSSFFLAISPWHLHYSRGGWETNVATFFLVSGVYLFLLALEKSQYWLLTAIAFALSFYVYQATRILMPLLVLGLVLLFFREVLKAKREVILAGILGFVLILPALLTFFGGGGTARFGGVSIFADPGPISQVNELRGEHQNQGGRVFHNKLSAYGISFLKKYSEHFSGDFLFIKGDPIPRNNVVDMGVLYLFDLPFLLLGFYFLFTKKPARRSFSEGGENFWALPVLWLLIAPVASGLTFQSPQALRALNMVIPLTIISAYGFYHTAKILSFNKKFLSIFLIFAFLFLIFDFSRYLHQYYVHNPKRQPIAFEYGFRDLVSYVSEVQGKYDKVLVTDRYDQPYILFLFYLSYPPQDFQKEAVLTARDKFGFSTVRNFSKYEFKSIKFEEDSNLKNTLIIGSPEEIPQNVRVIKEILYPNGKPAFKIVET